MLQLGDDSDIMYFAKGDGCVLQTERLRAAIEASGLSYETLGQLTGIAKSSIQRYATGNTKKIPVDAIDALAPHLNVSPTYLMGWDDNEEKDELVIPDILEGAKVAFHQGEFEDLTQDEVNRLAEFASFIKSQRKDKRVQHID